MSPSSTQESTSKQAASDDGQVATAAAQEERSITEEPESNDTSHGVEATAVRTLAATTGTVAILGTTAKTGDKKDSEEKDVVEAIPEEKEEAVAIIHEEKVNDNSYQLNSEEKTKDCVASEKALTPESVLVEKNEETLPKVSSIEHKSEHSESNKSVVNSPDEKSPGTISELTEPKAKEIIASDSIVLELAKEKEEDVSKSISSERLKTNSISNTTLSSDSIAEFENNSVKQSPSADKVIESFDSSSTVEFVDTTAKDVTKVEGSKTNPARSISSDLSNRASLPVDGEKTPDALSPNDIVDTAELTTSPLTDLQQVVKTTNDVPESPSNICNDEVVVSKDMEILSPKVDGDEMTTNSSLKVNTLNDTNSINSEENSDISNNANSLVKSDSSAQETNSPSAIENSSPNRSENNNKAETRSPFSSNDSSSFKENGRTVSPETEVAKTVISPVENINKENIISTVSNMAKNSSDLVNGVSSGSTTPAHNAAEATSNPDIPGTKSSLESVINELPETNVNGIMSDDVFGSPIHANDEKVVAAATTIQASFRGFQTRQNLKSNESVGIEGGKSELDKELNKDKLDEPIKPSDVLDNRLSNNDEIKSSLDEIGTKSTNEELPSSAQLIGNSPETVDEKLTAAATTIQANFRGYQTRQMMKTNLDSGLPPSEETDPSNERKTPTALTPELIESVKEEVDEICKEAETIAAERSESAEGMMKGVDQVVVESKTALPSVSESILAVRGSASPPSVSDAGAEESLDTEDSKGEVFDLSVDGDERAVQAATAIQATFRGFQTRKNLQKDSLEQVDVSTSILNS